MAELTLADIRPLYAFVDPHGGKGGPTAERLRRIASSAAIAVGGQDKHGRYFIVDAWADRCHTDILIDRMYATTDQWHLKSFGGESNGLAGLFHDALIRDARKTGKYLPLVKVSQPTNVEKDFRIRTALQPLVGNGRLFIARHLTVLIEQMCAFPMSMQKDLIDCVASLVRFIPARPQHSALREEQEALAKYLRDRGVDPAIIAKECGLPLPKESAWTSFRSQISR